MIANNSSDWAVLIIAVAFFSLIVYAIIHGRVQANKDKKGQLKGENKA